MLSDDSEFKKIFLCVLFRFLNKFVSRKRIFLMFILEEKSRAFLEVTQECGGFSESEFSLPISFTADTFLFKGRSFSGAKQ